MPIRTIITFAFASITTCTNAQLVYVPVEVPIPVQVNPVQFGVGLSVGDSELYIGGVGDEFSPTGGPTGVYEYDIDSLSYLQTYTGSGVNPASDFFGFDVQYYDGVLLVSAPFTEIDGDRVGSAFLFDPITQTILHTFEPPVSVLSSSVFGIDVSINDVAIIIGAPGSGARGQIFAYSAVTNELMVTLDPDLTTTDVDYGWVVEHNDDYLVVSAPGDVFDGFEGVVYVYDFKSGALLRRLTSPVPDTNGTGRFGRTMDLDGHTLIVGSGVNAPIGIRGKVAVYDLSAGTLLTLLDGDPTTDGDFFGASLSIEEDVAVIGAPEDSSNGAVTGAVYIYDMTTLTMTDKIMLPATATGQSFFGGRVKIKDGTIVATASTIAPPAGSSRVYVIKQFCRADINLDGSIDFFDISAFIKGGIDWNDDGAFDFFDISEFLQSYQTLCP